MQRSTVVTTLVTAVVFALIGWFAASKPGKPQVGPQVGHHNKNPDCRGKDCDVVIYFECTDPSNPLTCAAYAVPEVIVVKPNHKIFFTIDSTTHYEFNPTDGIKFTADNYFPCMSQGNKKFSCVIKNDTPPDLYKYSIHVEGMNKVDPWVVSQ